MEAGVYLIKERTAEEHELHKVFDGSKWYFGAAGISGALQVAEAGLQTGTFDEKGPSQRPLRIETLGELDAKRLATIAAAAKPPERVQLSRAKGWRMPANTVKVDRTTKWGNPFVPGKPVPVGPQKGQVVSDKRHAYVLYRAFAPLNLALIAAARAELAGKNLACWCSKDNPYEDACHASVLLELANSTDEAAKDLTDCPGAGI